MDMSFEIASGLTTRTHLDNAGSTARGEGEATNPRLLKAAQDFEAMLLESWWRSMKASFGEDDSEVGSEAMDDLGIQAMSTAVASGGGLGLAAALLEQLRTAPGGTVSPPEEGGTGSPVQGTSESAIAVDKS